MPKQGITWFTLAAGMQETLDEERTFILPPNAQTRNYIPKESE